MNEITLPQGTLRYRDTGTGAPVVFIHGLLVDGSLWDGVTAALSATHRCIAPDLPLGSHTVPMRADADLSPRGVAALVAAFVDALDLSDVTLVGNDSGGAISQLVAAHHPERIGRLVLTNCDALEVFPPRGFEYMSWLPRIPGLMTLMAHALYRVAALRRLSIVYGALTRRPLPDATTRAWVAPSARDRRIRRDAAKFIRGIRPAVTLDAAERLHGFERPALMLWGRDDPFFTLPLAERLAAQLPDARVEPIDDATVYAPIDAPDRVAAGIARFTSVWTPREVASVPAAG
jgi:pimeloyl-ACP methyl ester carboxylesterase